MFKAFFKKNYSDFRAFIHTISSKIKQDSQY